MATEKRLIDANALYDIVEEKRKTTYGYFLQIYRWFAHKVANAPTVDAVEVVRCCDCLHCIPYQQYADAEVILYCKKKRPAVVDPTDFCSYGERKTNEKV